MPPLDPSLSIPTGLQSFLDESPVPQQKPNVEQTLGRLVAVPPGEPKIKPGQETITDFLVQNSKTQVLDPNLLQGRPGLDKLALAQKTRLKQPSGLLSGETVESGFKAIGNLGQLVQDGVGGESGKLLRMENLCLIEDMIGAYTAFEDMRSWSGQRSGVKKEITSGQTRVEELGKKVETSGKVVEKSGNSITSGKKELDSEIEKFVEHERLLSKTGEFSDKLTQEQSDYRELLGRSIQGMQGKIESREQRVSECAKRLETIQLRIQGAMLRMGELIGLRSELPPENTEATTELETQIRQLNEQIEEDQELATKAELALDRATEQLEDAKFELVHYQTELTRLDEPHQELSKFRKELTERKNELEKSIQERVEVLTEEVKKFNDALQSIESSAKEVDEGSLVAHQSEETLNKHGASWWVGKLTYFATYSANLIKGGLSLISSNAKWLTTGLSVLGKITGVLNIAYGVVALKNAISALFEAHELSHVIKAANNRLEIEVDRLRSEGVPGTHEELFAKAKLNLPTEAAILKKATLQRQEALKEALAEGLAGVASVAAGVCSLAAIATGVLTPVSLALAGLGAAISVGFAIHTYRREVNEAKKIENLQSGLKEFQKAQSGGQSVDVGALATTNPQVKRIVESQHYQRMYGHNTPQEFTASELQEIIAGEILEIHGASIAEELINRLRQEPPPPRPSLVELDKAKPDNDPTKIKPDSWNPGETGQLLLDLKLSHEEIARIYYAGSVNEATTRLAKQLHLA